MKEKEQLLWYDKPAALWEAALPLGNGRFGAMVYGGTDEETLQLNDVTLWTGAPYPDADRADAYLSLDEIREKIRNEDFDGAQKLVAEKFTNVGGGFDDAYFCSYATMGEIHIAQTFAGEVSDYRRHLSLSEAVAGVSFTAGGVAYQREHFISAPAQTFVSRYTASKDGALTMTFSLRREYCTTEAAGNTLTMRGTAAGERGPMKLTVMLRVLTKGGTVTADTENGTLTVTGADEVLLFCAGGTDYIPNQEANYKREDPTVMVMLTLDVLLLGKNGDYEAMKRAHIADYRAYFDRLRLTLDDDDDHPELPTDARILRFNDGAADRGLITLYYQFGRYLMICSSRPENMLPANLQGIWCKDMSAPWHGDYHTNINVQMNYWPAGTANLTECIEPLAALIEGLVKNGRNTARAYYHANGWTVEPITNAFGWTSPGWGAPWGQFACAGAWLCTHLYEYYAFTQSAEVLERIYPVIRENCIFSMETLIRDKDGYLVTSPSASPENSFITETGKAGWICEGATMDIEIIHEELTEMIALCEIRGGDTEFLERLKKTRAELRPIRIGSAGQIREWSGDWDMTAPERNHRHISHLFGLYPGTMISKAETPELAKAAETSLFYRGDDGTGWSLAWKTCFRARLCDGDHAYLHLCRLLRYAGDRAGVYNYANGGGVYPNLFDAHPPFQIDGNFGAVAGINELFLHSHRMRPDHTYIQTLLPALPSVFANGEIDGIRGRGGFVWTLAWKNGALTAASVLSDYGKNCVAEGAYTVTDSGGNAVPVAYEDGCTVFATEPGMRYVLSRVSA